LRPGALSKALLSEQQYHQESFDVAAILSHKVSTDPDDLSHALHLSGPMTCAFSSSPIANTSGQSSGHAPQPEHNSLLTTGFGIQLPPWDFLHCIIFSRMALVIR
jgi:hypothetical protein